MSYRPGVVPSHDVMDTEFEEDGTDSSEVEGYSGRRSEDSMGKRSRSTVSSLDELQTPDTQDNEFNGFNFELAEAMRSAKSVEGPFGPHLFRMSSESVPELDSYMTMTPPTSPEATRIAPSKASSRTRQAEAPRTSVPLRTWTPRQVAEWMYATGFDRSIVDTFFINDISGLTLIDLQYEDLKELGIASFGQRHRLWSEIRSLKEQKLGEGFEEQLVFNELPPGPPAETYPTVPKPTACSNPTTPDEDVVVSPTSGRRRRRKQGGNDIILPAESASIVAIEQLLPKPHKCSKGENCTKWQKQQRKLARIATEFPAEMAQIINARNQSPTESGVAVTSLIVPSVVASSDVLGDALPAIRLAEENLKGLQARDPQENVRQFVEFQHLNKPKVAEPESPPYEMFPPLPNLPRSQAPHQHLQSLPKLTIPMEAAAADSLSPNLTAKPINRKSNMSPLHGFNISQQPVVHDLWRIGSPASEMDVPVTAIPLGPIERDASSSVPPDMRYGATLGTSISRSSSRAGFRDGPPPAFHMPSGAMSPISRSTSTNGHRRQPSLTTAPPPLREDTAAEAAAEKTQSQSPTEIDIDSDMTPTNSKPAHGDAHHDGWMKKRRTKMLRHEWQEAHFRLRGTQLAMHVDEQALSALEYIDVDDYAVAVSAAPGASKLNAAMRRLHLNNKRAALDSHAFAFQLTPAAERRGIKHAATGKTHHFAVRTATERIDWMRELMLARARKEKHVDIASFD